MNIKHEPVIGQKVFDFFHIEDLDYVCTTELTVSDVIYDIYYRETPHPKFGNCYVGVRPIIVNTNPNIEYVNADMIEELIFAMIEYNGVWYYSQSHHHCNSPAKGIAIDGGRQYTRVLGYESDLVCKRFQIKQGKFKEIKL